MASPPPPRWAGPACWSGRCARRRRVSGCPRWRRWRNGSERRREQPRSVADRQLPGQRARRRRGRLRLGLPAARRRRSAVLRPARAESGARRVADGARRAGFRRAALPQEHAGPRHPADRRRGRRRRRLRFLPALRAVGPDVPAGGLRPHRAAAGRLAAPQGHARSRHRLGRARRQADQRHQPYPLPDQAAAAPAHHRRADHPPARGAEASGWRSRSTSSSAPTSRSSAMSATRWRRCCTRRPTIGGPGCAASPSRWNGKGR